MQVKLLIPVFLLIYTFSFSQTDSSNIIKDRITEELLEEPDNETDDSDLYELVEYYLEHPVNLNTASLDALSSLPYLDISVAKIIIDHRRKYGKFFSANELYSVTGIPNDLVRKMLPFISVKDSTSSAGTENITSNKWTLNIRSRMQYGLQNRIGFINKKFPGSPIKLYNRLLLKYGNHVSAGFLIEKDPGEVPVNDFSSGYICIKNWYGFEKVIVVDYIIEFGQGLALWGPYGLTKRSDVISVKAASRGVIPYKSSTENRFFRGAAAKYYWEHVSLSGFVSKNYMDANVDSATGVILSTPQDGFHRTYRERLYRKAVKETAFGLTVNYNILPTLNLGFLFCSLLTDKQFNTSSNINNKADKSNYYSAYINLYILNYNIFAEFSAANNSLAYISGMKLSPSPGFSYICIIRNYPHTYKNLHGFGFAEHTGALNNEFGIYNGFRWRTGFGTLNFYYDMFRFPVALSDIPLPSEGHEFIINFVFNASKHISINTRLKAENKEVMAMFEEQERITSRLKKSCRLEFICNFSKNIRIKARFDYSSFFIKNTRGFEEGYLIFEDLRIQPVNDFIIYSRVIFFKTASFNSAVYEYENDLAGVLKNTGLYVEGLRLYIVVRYNLWEKLKISFKYSETYKPGESKLGTGYQEIPGNIDNNIALQADLEL